ILVALRVDELTGHNPLMYRNALAHDFVEAYIGDIVSPVKRVLGEPFAELEKRVRKALSLALGVEEETHPTIVQADLEMLMTEAHWLMAPPPEPWGVGVEPLKDSRYKPWCFPP